MVLDQGDGAGGIARQRRLHDLTVLIGAAAALPLGGHLGQKAVAVQLIEHHRPQAQQPALLTGRNQRGMKFAVPLHPFPVPLHPLRPGQALDDVQPVMRRNDPAFPVIIAQPDRLGDRLTLKIQEMLGHLDQLGPRHRRDAKPLARLQCHEAFRDQLRQRLADRANAQIVALGQVGEFQLGFGCKDIVGDVRAQANDNILTGILLAARRLGTRGFCKIMKHGTCLPS